MNNKFYAVKIGRKIGVYTNWNDCKKQIHKYPKAKYKSFLTLEEAEKYSNTKGVKGVKVKHKKQLKICPLCEKPHKQGTQCCSMCSKKLKEIKPFVEPYSNTKKVSINKVLNVKLKYNVNDVFDFIRKNPYVWKRLDVYKQRLTQKRKLREYQRSDEYRKQQYKKWTSDIPLYIYELMKLHPLKQFLTISGDKANPNIHYVCIKCGEEQIQTYEDLRNNKGHECKDSKSSGEIIVENYLKSIVKIKTQFETLKCINPITQRQLPYDIEIINKKILIEIQGEQHLKYIEYFHGTIENFYYQQRKDDYKKRFAESKGYKMIYIYYDELKNNLYKFKIKKALNEDISIEF